MSNHMQNALSTLKQNLFSLMELTEGTLDLAVQSITEVDAAKAKEVASTDDNLDRMEVELEEDCLKILALHQPVAKDLRFIVTVLKVINDLERIGDLAVNISERVETICKTPNIEAPYNFTQMAEKTKELLKKAIDALVEKDADLAKSVCQEDIEIDMIHKDVYKKIHEAVKKDPENVDYYLQFLSTSKNLERIGDYATNIAEDIIYMITGEIVRHSPSLYK